MGTTCLCAEHTVLMELPAHGRIGHQMSKDTKFRITAMIATTYWNFILYNKRRDTKFMVRMAPLGRLLLVCPSAKKEMKYRQ